MLPNECFHIYNHANGNENLFVEPRNYDFFLGRLSTFVYPVCKIFSYGLMPNHFHLILQARAKKVLTDLWQDETMAESTIKFKINKSFSNMFSSYTQSFNKVYDRMGSLFMSNMKSKILRTEEDIRRAIFYTHSNPVHHGFTKKIEEWPYTSYYSLLSNKLTKLEREYVLRLFGGAEGFKKYHEQKLDSKIFEFEL